MTAHHYDAVVVGGGVIGLFTARALHRTGRRVALFDAGPVGAEASHAGGGILSPLQPWAEVPAVQALSRDSQRQYPAIARTLLRTTGVDVQYEQSGALFLAPEQHGPLDAWGNASGVAVQKLDSGRTAALDAAVTPVASRFLPGLAHVRNPRLLKALCLELEQCGVAIRPFDAVRSITREGDRVSGVESQSGQTSAPVVVVAAGAWSAPLLRPLGVDCGVYPVRGQMLWYAPFEGSPRHLVLGNGIYVIPRRDGVCLAGSTVEDAGFEKIITPSARTEIVRKAAALVPGLAGRAPAGQWCGLRPALRGPEPLIGPAGGVSGLFTNLGHFRNGITLAPASAAKIARSC